MLLGPMPNNPPSITNDKKYWAARKSLSYTLKKYFYFKYVASFKVSVPDNPAFPETVDLELITDWKVDSAGEEAGLTRNVEGD